MASLAPDVLLVHGFLDRAAIWSRVQALISVQGLESEALDLAGAGARADDPGPFSLERGAAEIVAWGKARQGRPLMLVGHSMGAQMVELAARELGDQVRGLALLTPVALAGVTLPPDLVSLLRASGGDLEAQRRIRGLFSKALDASALALLLAPEGLMGPQAAAGWFDAFTTGNPLGRAASQFDGPVKVLVAEGDPVVPVEAAAAVAARFSGATGDLITEAGHWPHMERPQAVADALVAFHRQAS